MPEPRHATAETFADLIASGPVVLEFWAPWCGISEQPDLILTELHREFGHRFDLVRANTEDVPDQSADLGVHQLPTILFLRDGAIVETVVGPAPKPVLREKLADLLGTTR